MATIYLDHNIIAGIAGIPGVSDAPDLLKHVKLLQAHGHRFVLSAWNMYELARSNNQQHIDQCCRFVENLDPLWVSDSTKVKRQEVDRFLQPEFDKIGPVRNRNFSPFNATVPEMWGSFGERGRPDETFTSSVATLRAHPVFLADVDRSAKVTPEAILIGRQAQTDGRAKLLQGVIDREHLELFLPGAGSEWRDRLVARLYPAGATPLEPSERSEWLDYLMATHRKLLAASPALAVEEAMSKLRVRESFTPEPADAADLQHAMVPLGYCDYFVTNDGQLAEHCIAVIRQRKLACKVLRSLKLVAP